MSYPKTQEEWWQIANDQDDNINKMMRMVANIRDVHTRTRFTDQDILDYRNAKEEKNVWRMMESLNRVWWIMPESICRGLPGWFALCDLCSEGPGIFEEEYE